jgi:hypothetical protein
MIVIVLRLRELEVARSVLRPLGVPGRLGLRLLLMLPLMLVLLVCVRLGLGQRHTMLSLMRMRDAVRERTHGLTKPREQRRRKQDGPRQRV